ncbi:electron transport complex subunit RsxB [Buchnera aphidicola]|uniref:electron transport complex subunit RsxB n=1 Tax=Buchnera aphidicola TaxID=9 RepID=UPI003BEF00FB
MKVIIIFSILSFFLGIILSYSADIFKVDRDPIIDKINNFFPQSQCGQCGYSGCYSYANAIIQKKEKINKCIPGGEEVILNISQLLNITLSSKNVKKNKKKIFDTIVVIDENNCVGCSKCASFCPVDAIVGAPNYMHTILKDFCTGCNICLLHCPTDCITIKKNNHEKYNNINNKKIF